MISNYISPDRNNKLMPTSPQARRKHPDFPSPQPQQQVVQQRKDPVSPQHFYGQKMQVKGVEVGGCEKEYGLQGVVRQLSERVGRLAQKVAQHEGVLIKMSENSVESNKEECKKGSKGDPRHLDTLNDTLARLRREFDDYRAGNITTREIEVKNHLFSELIHKSEERMRAELREMLKGGGAEGAERRLEEADRLVRKLQKNVSLNTSNIFGCMQRVQALSGSLEGHIELINEQFNRAYNKIVGFVNDKFSKFINDSLTRLTQRIDLLEGTPLHFGEMRSSGEKSERQASRAEYRETLLAFNHQIWKKERTYFIDAEGYLLDEEHFYLTDGNEQRIKLEEAHLQLLKKAHLFP